MLRSPKAPLVFGTVMIFALASYLTLYHPSPGELAASHAAIEGLTVLSGCERCHAEEGLSAGCLGCHEEIAAQFSSDTGYHAYLAKNGGHECRDCHPEHNGEDFQLVSALSWRGEGPELFAHPHVDFRLRGRHDALSCGACHERSAPAASPVPGFGRLVRRSTFLGVRQDCRHCHEDVHAGGLSGACESCHGQESFRPATFFRHEGFPLTGPHSAVACGGCHPQVTPEGPSELTFHKVRGTTCRECHDSPHRVAWGKKCVDCHSAEAPTWADAAGRVTPDDHALAGFRLEPPHAETPCAGCHNPQLPFSERYPDPRAARHARREERCEACHDDVHAGQFAAKYPGCLDCHERTRFVPARFGIEHHTTYLLEAAHSIVPCHSCHLEDPATRVRRFVGLGRRCDDCHEDPHGGQFVTAYSQCDDCHGRDRFVPALFGLERHQTYPLKGPHGAVPCRSCHREDPSTRAQKFIGTEDRCQGCHEDPHGGQFARELQAADCDTCHDPEALTFSIRPFDHKARAGYPLEGAHAKAGCNDCHALRPRDSSLASVRQFRGTSRLCSSCHTDAHRGQFAGESCRTCHSSTESWAELRFDHDRQARFPLDGRHENVACASCHPTVKLRGKGEVVQYKPISTECKDCHVFTTR